MNQGCIVAQVTAQEEIMKIISQVHQAVACSQKVRSHHCNNLNLIRTILYSHRLVGTEVTRYNPN